jgi:AraC-like DNA-binding protein
VRARPQSLDGSGRIEGVRRPESGPATKTRDTAEEVRVFTTAGVPAEDRIELWQAHNSAALMSLRCHALTDAQFDGTTVNVRLARTRLCRVRADTAHIIERRSDLIASRPEDSVVLFFVLVGEAFFYHSAGVHIVGSGQMVACDSDRPFMRGFSTDCEELFLKIPRHVFCEIAGIDRLEAPIVTAFTTGQNLFGASLAGLIAAATRADNPTLPDEHALLDLVGALVGGQDHGPTSAYLAAARRYVDARLTDTSLCAASIAGAVGISPRHLSRTFATVGTTVPQYVLGRRLTAANAILHRYEASSMSIAEVAQRCGFISVSHFSKSFAAQFGEHASDVRRRVMRQREVAAALVTGSPTGGEPAETAIVARIGQKGPNRSLCTR